MNSRHVSDLAGLLAIIVLGVGVMLGIGRITAHALNTYIASSLPTSRESSPSLQTETRNNGLLAELHADTLAEAQSKTASGNLNDNRPARSSEVPGGASRGTTRERGRLHGRAKEAASVPFSDQLLVARRIRPDGSRITENRESARNTVDSEMLKDKLSFDVPGETSNGLKLSAMAGAAASRSTNQEWRRQVLKHAKRQHVLQYELREKMQRLQVEIMNTVGAGREDASWNTPWGHVGTQIYLRAAGDRLHITESEELP